MSSGLKAVTEVATCVAGRLMQHRIDGWDRAGYPQRARPGTDKSFAAQDGVLTLRGRLAWAHDFNPDRSIATTFQALPRASFVFNGAAQARDSTLTSASLEMKWLSGWSVAATLEGEFSSVTRSSVGEGSVRYAW